VQLTIREAATILRVPVATVHRWIRDRGLPAVKFNEQYRLNQVDLLVWAQTNHVLLDPEQLPVKEPTAPTVSGALVRGGIHRHLAGNDRQQVLLAAIAAMPLPNELDRAQLAQMLSAREALGSTSVGNGIAIPHARHPIVLPLGMPLLSLGFLQQPVEFGAQDGVKVHTLFTMITPTIRIHLHFLARLAFALGGDFGRRVAERADDAAILEALRAAEKIAAAKPPAGPTGAD